MDCIVHISNNQITDKKAVSSFFNELEDGKYLLTAKSIKRRSLPQNNYYWAIVVPMIKEGLRDAGYNEVKTNEDAHEILKHLFLKKRYKSENDENEIVVAGSTASLKTVEFNQFLEEVWRWASEYLSINIPEPNQQMALYD